MRDDDVASDSDGDGDSSDEMPAMIPVSELATAAVAVRRAPPLHVLLIHGLYAGTDWFLDAITGRPLAQGRPLRSAEMEAQHAWLDAVCDHRDFAHCEMEEAVASCQRAIASGQYHAIVLCDLSARDLLPAFEAHLGPLLQAFADGGGSVAFTTSEGLLLPPTLARLFGTSWQPGAYYRTAWASHSSAARHLFCATHELAALEAKACCLTGVPPEEMLFGAPRARRPASSAAQRVVRVDTTDTADSATSDDGDDARDVAVAVHAYGHGRVGYFGDAFCTPTTVGLLAAFCRATATLTESETPIVPGSCVRVHGLRSRPELNGVCGTVLRRQGDERWQVRLADGMAELALKAANLEVDAAVEELAAKETATLTESETPIVPGSRVRVHGLRSRPELNGVCGTVLRRQGDERWQVEVRLADGLAESLALKAANLEVQVDAAAEDLAAKEIAAE